MRLWRIHFVFIFNYKEFIIMYYQEEAEKKEEAPAPDPGLPRKFVADRPEDGARER